MTILTSGHPKTHRRGFWFGTGRSTRVSEYITLTPKERAIAIAMVAVLVVAIALVVLIEH
jgi:hypothetical protein